MESNQLAGVAAYLFRHGKSAYQYCTGWLDKEKAIPLKEDAIYLTCSLSKTFTIVTLMTLYEKGLFRLEDPVSRFIPEFKDVTVAEEYFGSTRFVPAKREDGGTSLHHDFRSAVPSSSSISAKEFGRLSGGNLKSRWTGTNDFGKGKNCCENASFLSPGGGLALRFFFRCFGRSYRGDFREAFGEYMKEALLDPLGLTDTGFF